MKKIYVCSKLRGDVENNIKYAQKICRKIVMDGDIPIAPHLYFTQFLDDNVEEERNKAMNINFNIIEKCDYLLVCNKDISEGMKAEIEYAKEHNIEIRYL